MEIVVFYNTNLTLPLYQTTKLLKAFADNKIDFSKIMIFVHDRVENIVGKGENAG